MPLNKCKGNMYNFITHTFNIVKGVCPHQCGYCYMKRHWPRMSAPRLDESELRTKIESGQYIFVGSSIDLFAKDIPFEWQAKVLDFCSQNPGKYLFQSKNPAGFNQHVYPKNTILCTTLETNRTPCKLFLGNCPIPEKRMQDFMDLPYRKMITIEPVMDFDIDIFIQWIRIIDPIQVNIGADSGGNNLPEPSPQKLRDFIVALKMGNIKVHIKKNLKRLYQGERCQK